MITDEARHVHYGVLALQEYFRELTERERREREDWAFEVSLLLRNRFLAHEFYEEYYAHAMTRRAQWEQLVLQSRADEAVPQDDVQAHHPQPEAHRAALRSDPPQYAELGLLEFEHGRAAPELTAEDLLADR